MNESIGLLASTVTALGLTIWNFVQIWENRALKRKLEAYQYGWELGEQRQIEKDTEIIQLAEEELWLLGTNALGPLHEAREGIINLLKKRGAVRVLLLNPRSKAFEELEREQERLNDQLTGRCRAEYEASLAICRDINHFCLGRGRFELKVRSERPTFALVIADRKKRKGILHANIYPDKKQKRGYMGKHLAVPNQEPWIEDFSKWVTKFEVLWSLSENIDLALTDNKQLG